MKSYNNTTKYRSSNILEFLTTVNIGKNQNSGCGGCSGQWLKDYVVGRCPAVATIRSSVAV